MSAQPVTSTENYQSAAARQTTNAANVVIPPVLPTSPLRAGLLTLLQPLLALVPLPTRFCQLD